MHWTACTAAWPTPAVVSMTMKASTPPAQQPSKAFGRVRTRRVKYRPERLDAWEMNGSAVGEPPLEEYVYTTREPSGRPSHRVVGVGWYVCPY